MGIWFNMLRRSASQTEANTIGMVGTEIGTLTVSRKAPSCGHGARWWLTCKCGHEQIVEGSMLRRTLKIKQMIRCKGCRA